MALKQCKECGNTVSNQAKTCPHCGAAVRKSRWGIVILFALIVGACVIGLPIMAGRHAMVTEQKKPIVESTVKEGLSEKYGVQCTSVNLLEGADSRFAGTAKLEDGRELDVDAKIDGDMVRFTHQVKQGYEYKCKHHIDQLKLLVSPEDFDYKEHGAFVGEVWNDGSEPIRGFVVAEFIDDNGRVYQKYREIVVSSNDWWIPPGKSATFEFSMPAEILKENAINTKVEFFNLGNEPMASYVGENLSDKNVLETIPVKVTSQTYKILKEKAGSEEWQGIFRRLMNRMYRVNVGE